MGVAITVVVAVTGTVGETSGVPKVAPGLTVAVAVGSIVGFTVASGVRVPIGWGVNVASLTCPPAISKTRSTTYPGAPRAPRFSPLTVTVTDPALPMRNSIRSLP